MTKILHLVMWKLKGENALEREAQAKSFSAEFAKLLGRVPGLSSLDVGPNWLKNLNLAFFKQLPRRLYALVVTK
jgi:hypothetical protein